MLSVSRLLLCLCTLCTCLQAQPPSIYQHLQANNYSRLLQWVDQAGLQQLLDGTAEPVALTLFAPTDAAIQALPADVVTAVQSNVTLLRTILEGHVTNQVIINQFVRDGMTKASRLDTPLNFNVYTNNVRTVNGARLQQGALVSNGAVFGVDRVLLPLRVSLAGTVAETDTQFRDLFGFLLLTGLYDSLTSGGPFTLFAPTDSAFSKVDVAALLQNRTALAEVLKNHVVDKAYWSAGLTDGLTLDTLAGSQLTVSLQTGVRVNGALVTSADMGANNGVIHVIDTVLSP